MPVKPKAEETEQEFIGRCMSEEKDSFPDSTQRIAVCISKWENREMSATEDITDVNDELETEVAQGFAYATKESQEFATLPSTDCMEKHKSAGYTEDYAKMACTKKSKVEEEIQGGVVSQMSQEDFGRKAFEFLPESKETMSTFMARCMSSEMVREKKQNRTSRVAFCYSMFEKKYINNIAKNWK